MHVFKNIDGCKCHYQKMIIKGMNILDRIPPISINSTPNIVVSQTPKSTQEKSALKTVVGSVLYDNMNVEIAAERIKKMQSSSIQESMLYIQEKESKYTGKTRAESFKKEKLGKLLGLLQQTQNITPSGSTVNGTNSNSKGRTKVHRSASVPNFPIEMAGSSGISNEVVNATQQALKDLGYGEIHNLKSRLDQTTSLVLSEQDLKQLNEASLLLRLSEFEDTPEKLYDLHEAIERQEGAVTPLLNTELLQGFELKLKEKSNNEFRYSTIRESTIERWKDAPVRDIQGYQRPDFLQESHKVKGALKNVDLQRAVHLREAGSSSTETNSNNTNSELTGADLLDSKVSAYVIDAYTLAPVRARETDIEHLQSFDNFKEKVALFFNRLNEGSKILKQTVLGKYGSDGPVLKVVGSKRGKRIVPTEYTMRMLYNLHANTVLMSHYFNVVKGTQETGDVLQGSSSYGPPFVQRFSRSSETKKVSDLIDRWTVISTLKSDATVNEEFRGKPLYEAIKSWIGERSEIQGQLITRSEDLDRKGYLYIVANRIQKDTRLAMPLRENLREATLATLLSEKEGKLTPKLRRDLKALVLQSYKVLEKVPSPGVLRATAASGGRGLSVQDVNRGGIIGGSVGSSRTGSLSGADSHVGRLANEGSEVDSQLSEDLYLDQVQQQQQTSIQQMMLQLEQLTTGQEVSNTMIKGLKVVLQEHEVVTLQHEVVIQEQKVVIQQQAEKIQELEQKINK